MRLQWLGPGLIALALGASFPRAARAQTDGPATAVLGLEPIDTPGALADAISEQLRQKVAAARDLRLVSGKDLVELKLVFSCADEAASCIAQAGKRLDAQKLIYGSIKKIGDDYAVWLKLFDVRKEKIETWLTETLTKRQTDVPGLKAATARWFAKLTGRPMNTGTVQITANISGATISLDGIPAGSTGEQPLTISDVAPGKHELLVEKAGHAPAKQEFTLAAGQTVPVNLSLHRTSEGTGEPAPGFTVAQTERTGAGRDSEATDGRAGYRTGFWVTLAAGLVSAGAAVKFGLDVVSVNKDLDQYRRYPCLPSTVSPGGLCDAKGTTPLTALNQDQKNQVAKKTDEGNRDQTLQWICVGVGSALGIASGYLLYKGYLDSDDEKGHKEAHQGLRIFPTAGTSSGGILAEFDF